MLVVDTALYILLSCVGSLGSSLGLTHHKWTTISHVDEPRYVNVDDDGPSDLPITSLHHNRPAISFSDEYRRLPPGLAAIVHHCGAMH